MSSHSREIRSLRRRHGRFLYETAPQVALRDGEFSAVAELYVDGQLVERRSIQRHEQAYLTTLGDVPVGEAVFNIRPYYGRRVEVKIEASMRFDGGYGQGAVRNMTIPVYSSQP